MLTLDLKKSNNHDTIQGKLILNLSTNVNAPIRNGTNTLASGPSSHNVSSSVNTQQQASTTVAATASSSNNSSNNNTTTTASTAEQDNDLPEGYII